MVRARPAQDPVTPRITEIGAIRYGKFPVEQSLLNRYREFLRIWREAFQKVVSVSAPVPTSKGDMMAIGNEELACLDYGTKARLRLIMAVLREQKLENDRLKELITKQIPAPGRLIEGRPTAIDPIHAVALRGWLSKIESGTAGLEIKGGGAKITRHARPGLVVIPTDVLDAVKAVCATANQSLLEITKED
jgi:hypothetical protein